MSRTAGPLGKLVPSPGRIAPDDAAWLSEQARQRGQTFAEFIHTLVARAGGAHRQRVTVTNQPEQAVTVTDQIPRSSQDRIEAEEAAT